MSRLQSFALGFALTLALLVGLRWFDPPRTVPGGVTPARSAGPAVSAGGTPQMPPPVADLDAGGIARVAEAVAPAAPAPVAPAPSVASRAPEVAAPDGRGGENGPSAGIGSGELRVEPAPTPLTSEPGQSPGVPLATPQGPLPQAATVEAGPLVAGPGSGAGRGLTGATAGDRLALEPVCAELARNDTAAAARRLGELPPAMLASLEGDALAAVVFFNASVLAVRAGDCAEARRLARLAAAHDDPWRVPSNLSWLRTLEQIRHCDDFNLETVAGVVQLKPPPPESCPSPVPPGTSPNLKNRMR